MEDCPKNNEEMMDELEIEEYSVEANEESGENSGNPENSEN